MRTKTTTVTYLQMFEAPGGSPTAPTEGVRVAAIQPSPADYLAIYRLVGETYDWVDRLRMPRSDLEAILDDAKVDVYYLTVNDQIAGFAELDARVNDEIELAYFGLAPEFVGRGLGKYFLAKIVSLAWERRPRRLWVHTCDLDHPAALPNYRKAGFAIYNREVIEQPLDY